MSNHPRVSLRPAVAALPPYIPGARSAPGAAAFKVSSNENPFPPPAAVVSAIIDAAADANRYPDMYATELTEAIAEMIQLSPDKIVVGNGSVAVLSHVLEAFVDAGDEVIHPWRSFEAYPIAISIAGGISVPVPLATGSRAGHLDLQAMAQAVTPRTKVILVCTPNNPTGPSVQRGELLEFLAGVPRNVVVVLDEAYLEFVRDSQAPDGVAIARDYGNVVLLRTFSKAYGLAGLRVGYAVARPRLASGIRAVSTPFGVSHVAQQAALAALRCRPELERRVEQLVAERERMIRGLADRGMVVPASQANFVWLGLGSQTTAFTQEARAAGILVRPFAGDGVRVSVGEPEATDILFQVVERWGLERSSQSA